MNLILCGLPMSGKSTIGRLLAKHLHREFIDTDRSIERAYKEKTGESLSCRDIYIKLGESAFRKLEREQLAGLALKSSAVVSLGGGCLVEVQSRELVKTIGCVIYLQASPELIWKRVVSRGLPAYLDPKDPEGSFYALSRARVHDYEAVATLIVSTDNLSEEEIVKNIMEKI